MVRSRVPAGRKDSGATRGAVSEWYRLAPSSSVATLVPYSNSGFCSRDGSGADITRRRASVLPSSSVARSAGVATLLAWTVARPAMPTTGMATRIAIRMLRPTDSAAMRRERRKASRTLPVLLVGRVERGGVTPVFR